MDKDEENGERKICIRQASGMESTANKGKTQLASTEKTAPDPLISQATMAPTKTATTEPTTSATTIQAATAGTYRIPYGTTTSPAATVPTTTGNLHAIATAAPKWIPETVECGSVKGRSGR